MVPQVPHMFLSVVSNISNLKKLKKLSTSVVTRMEMQLVFCCNALREIFGYSQRLFQINSLARHCNKVHQDIFIQAGTESHPSQGQVGEAQEKIHCTEEGKRSH